MPSDYAFDQSFAEERKRLSAMESLWDPGTQALFTEVGFRDAENPWHCLEVGAGGGSMVKWMTSHGATVVAVDIDTRFIDSLASERVEIRRLDLRADELPGAEFDLIHARLVLEHLADRRLILDKLAAALRPGGWIVIEDYDWTSFGLEEEDPAVTRVTDAVLGFMQRAGFDPLYGRRVVADLAATGFTDLRGEGRCRVIDSSSPGFEFFRLSFESLRGAVVHAGLVSAEDAEVAAERFAGEEGRILTPIMMAGIGRRSGS